ncbi:MAG: C40 family peptidase [Lachnospiraceae bacterium]|nr:C40 family peptidase [Lachnospiraceae bacterium]
MKNTYISLKIFGLVAVAFISVAAFSDTTSAAEVTSGVSSVFTDALSEDTTTTAGISSYLADCIETSNAQATLMYAEDATTSSSYGSIAGFTNLGIAIVEGNLNVRESASEDAELVGKMPGDSACEILGTEGDWTYIESGDVTGYVKTEYLITGSEAREYAQSLVTTVASCNTVTLRVRQEASTESEILALMGEGEELEVIEDLGDWIKVNVDDEEGYISAEYVTVEDKLPTAMTMSEVQYGQGVSDVRVALTQFACQFVGNPYVWGGTSLTNGADCSGFVLSVFAQYGIYLPHSSAAQAGYGTRISASEAQPGDLFFYGSGSSISHVAIYIGNGQIVHASNARTGIKISSAYYRSPICVTRLLGN